jgi:translation initiation factor 2 subunit 1
MKPTKYPVIDSITMVMVTKITNSYISVNLIEYHNLEGLILLSELSKGRIRSISKIASIGKKFAALVTCIDNSNNSDEDNIAITLSKKLVSDEEASICEENYRKSRVINNVINLLSNKLRKDYSVEVSIELLYNTFIWNISHDPSQIMKALKYSTVKFDDAYANKLDNVDMTWIKVFKEILDIKFKDVEIILEAIIEIKCLESSGAKIIRDVLLKTLTDNNHPFTIKLVKAPFYAITMKTKKDADGCKIISDILEYIITNMAPYKSSTRIVRKPTHASDEAFEPVSDSDTE